MDGKRARWADYLPSAAIQANPPSTQFRADGLRPVDADRFIDETLPSPDEVIETMAIFKDEKAIVACNISVELFTARGSWVSCMQS